MHDSPVHAPPPAPRLSDGRIPELDGLRGLAVLSVIAWHYLGLPLMAGHARGAATLGSALILCRSGVDLFFVLSGFLITGILLDNRESPVLFRVFYTRRFLRIMPVYYLVLLPFVLLAALNAEARVPALTATENPIPMAAYATFTQNVFMAIKGWYGAPWGDVTWSLAVEEQFYLVLPAVVRYVAPSRLPRLFIVGIVAAVGLRIACYLGLPEAQAYMAGYVLTPCRLDALLLGGLVAWALRQPRWAEVLRARRRRAAWLLAALVPGVVVLARAVAHDMQAPMALWGHTYLAAFYGLALLCALLWSGERATAALRLPLLAAMGTISYAAYLVHSIVLRLAFQVWGRPLVLTSPAALLVIAAAFVVTVVVCRLSWRLLERRCVAYGRRFRYDPAAAAAGRGAAPVAASPEKAVASRAPE
jgi:peptidoglycan/LPS O-acetylase OafA/YrhL